MLASEGLVSGGVVEGKPAAFSRRHEEYAQVAERIVESQLRPVGSVQRYDPLGGRLLRSRGRGLRCQCQLSEVAFLRPQPSLQIDNLTFELIRVDLHRAHTVGELETQAVHLLL